MNRKLNRKFFSRKATAFLTLMTEIKYISIMISKSRFRRVESRGRQVIITLGSWRFLALIGQSHLFTILKLFRRIVFFYFGLIKNFLKFSGSKIFQFFRYLQKWSLWATLSLKFFSSRFIFLITNQSETSSLWTLLNS